MSDGTPISTFFARGLIAFLIIGASLYWLQKARKEKQEEARQKSEAAAEIRKVKESIGKVGETYNAVVDWRPKVISDTQSAPQYSVELENLLVRQDGRPILFVGELHDVLSVKGALQCIFDTKGGFSWKVRFYLACTSDQAKLLTEIRSPNPLQRFAVVAHITSASKSAQEAVESDESQTSAPKFWANGRCVDFLFVGSYLYELELLPSDRDGITPKGE